MFSFKHGKSNNRPIRMFVTFVANMNASATKRILQDPASRLLKNAHLPFDRPFDKLTVLSNVEGLMALSGLTTFNLSR